MPAHHAVFIEPLACSIHAVQRGNIEFQDTVVIAGAGPLGLGMIAAARMKQPAPSSSPSTSTTPASRWPSRCGADIGLNPTKVDVVDEVKKLTDGYGCDVYIEATGHPQAVVDGLSMIRKLGTFVEFSVMREPVTVDWTIIGDTKELDIHGAHLSPHTYPVAIRMLEEGLLPMDEIVTQRMPLADFQAGHRPRRLRQDLDQGDAGAVSRAAGLARRLAAAGVLLILAAAPLAAADPPPGTQVREERQGDVTVRIAVPDAATNARVFGVPLEHPQCPAGLGRDRQRARPTSRSTSPSSPTPSTSPRAKPPGASTNGCTPRPTPRATRSSPPAGCPTGSPPARPPPATSSPTARPG